MAQIDKRIKIILFQKHGKVYSGVMLRLAVLFFIGLSMATMAHAQQSPISSVYLGTNGHLMSMPRSPDHKCLRRPMR